MHEISTTIISARKKEIVRQYLAELDKHIQQLKEGQADRALEIRENPPAIYMKNVWFALPKNYSSLQHCLYHILLHA